MKTWNELCRVTDLPIYKDDMVAAFVLQSHRQNTFCGYPDDVYTTVGFPIIGQYNGHGGLKNPKTPTWNKCALSLLKTPDEDYPIMFVHKDIYDQLIDNMSKRIPLGKTEPYRDCFKDELIRTIQANRLPFIGRNLFFSGPYANETPARLFRRNYTGTTNTKTRQSCIEFAADYQLFYHALLLLHKTYAPNPNIDNQNEETALHVLTSRFILNKASCQGNDGFAEQVVCD